MDYLLEWDLSYIIWWINVGCNFITDYSSSPVTPRGQIIFALGCGILTSVIRLWVDILKDFLFHTANECGSPFNR